MDVVYPVRDGIINEELRYSLRSLSNVPHDQVFMVGSKPHWVRNVIHLPRKQLGMTKYYNSTQNILTACADPRVSDNFILMNDDFYIMKPIKEIPTRHRGPVADVLAKYKADYGTNDYISGMQATYELIKAWYNNEPFSYELHIPMVFNKTKFLEMWEVGKHIHPLHKRTLYGNMFNIGGEYMDDAKVTFKKRQANTNEFLSTDEGSFLMLGQHKGLGKVFSQKSRYEK